MSRGLHINRVAVHRFVYEIADLAMDYNGFNSVHKAHSCLPHTGYVLTIGTTGGVVGEYVGGSAASYAQVGMLAHYLLGRDSLQREGIYNDLKRGLRKHDRMGIGPVDIALWDIAGKVYDAPVSQLLGGFRCTLPAYASTYHGDDNGGLSTPEAFGECAAQCREMGYPAFKIHGWGNGPIEREVATVLETRRAVGDGMDLMLDPACEYNTWSDALKVGLACDEARYLWLEDPYKDGGISAFGHRKLRQIIKTPILIGEHIRGHELHVDNIVADGTDFVRADADYDCGITGLMKIAHSAKGLGWTSRSTRLAPRTAMQWPRSATPTTTSSAWCIPGFAPPNRRCTRATILTSSTPLIRTGTSVCRSAPVSARRSTGTGSEPTRPTRWCTNRGRYGNRDQGGPRHLLRAGLSHSRRRARCASGPESGDPRIRAASRRAHRAVAGRRSAARHVQGVAIRSTLRARPV